MLPRSSPCQRQSIRAWQVWLGVILLPTLVFLAYQPVWQGAFLWDDGFLVRENPLIRSPVFLLETFRHYLFPDSTSQFYRPVQNISYILDYWRGGLEPAVYHQTNLLIHAVAAVLLCFLLRGWLQKLGGFSLNRSFFLALTISVIWALHPVHSAICAYISGRADSLALSFFLLGWTFWEKAGQCFTEDSQKRGKWWGGAAAFSALLATCSKEIAAAGLLLFVLHLWVVRPEITRKIRIHSSLAAVLTFALYLVLRNLPEIASTIGSTPGFPWLKRIEMFFRAQGDYFRLLIFPDRLYMERQVIPQISLFHQPMEFDPLFPWLGWLGGLFLVLLTAGILWRAEGRRLRIFGALWFMVMILPVSNLFSLNASVAEHWLYIPSIGFLIFLTGCWTGTSPSIRRLAGFATMLAIPALGFRTWHRAADWKDGLTFYQATIRDGGDSVRMRINLAAEYQKMGHLQEAVNLYRSILTLRPGDGLVENLLATTLRTQGKTAEAAAILLQLPQSPSGDLNERISFLNQLIQTGQFDPALTVARSVYEAHPSSWAAASLLSVIYQKIGRPDAALIVVQGYAERHWWDYNSHKSLGELFALNHQPENAIQAWEDTSRLDVRDTSALHLAVALLGDLSRFDQAEELEKEAIHRRSSAVEWNILADIYRAQKDGTAEAVARRKAREAADGSGN